MPNDTATMPEPFEIVAIAAIIDPRTMEMLFVRTRRHPENWQPVGGRYEPRDGSIIAGVIREIREEVGIEVTPSECFYVCSSPHDYKPGVVHSFVVWRPRLECHVTLNVDELIEYRWVSLLGIPTVNFETAARDLVESCVNQPLAMPLDDDINELRRPLRLPCGVELRGRIAKSAMSEKLATARGRPTDQLVRLYEIWASSNAGLLITGNVIVSTAAYERGNLLASGVESEGFRRLCSVAQMFGSRLLVQIGHPGRRNGVGPVRGLPLSPSSAWLRCWGLPIFPIHAASTSELESVADAMADTAQKAVSAGAAGVQLHAGHGFLLSSLVRRSLNDRTDKWGDPIWAIGRVVRRVRAVLPPRSIVSLKISAPDFRQGWSAADLRRFMRSLVDCGVDLLEISGGSIEGVQTFGVTPHARRLVRARESFFDSFIRQVGEFDERPLMMVCGGARTKSGMASLLRDGVADLIGAARPFAMLPTWPTEILRGRDPEIPLPPSTSIALVDYLLANPYWYAEQLRELAEVGKPSPGLGAASTITRNLCNIARQGFR